MSGPQNANKVIDRCDNGNGVVDKMEIVYTRREDRNSKRFLTLPSSAIDKWPIITRRVTIDLDSGIVVADEVVRGLSRYHSGLAE